MARVHCITRIPAVQRRGYVAERRTTTPPHGHLSDAWPINFVFTHYDKRGLVGKSVFWAVLVVAVSTALDYGVGYLQWPWLKEHLVVNIVQGALLGIAVWAFLKARDQRLQRRFKELGYLNHHVRNSLVTISFAEGYIPEAGQRLEMITEATRRIRRCIEKISREEDCEIDEQSPNEP